MRWRSLVLAFSLFPGLWAGDTVRVVVSGWTTLNPLLLSLDSDSEPADLLFDRLVTLNAKGEFIPELLESWTVLKGGREVVLKLRSGMTWHDGQPIEAGDVVFTWQALRLPRVRQIADTAAGVTSLDSLTAEGPLTVRIRLKRPRGTLLSDLYNFIPVPRHLYQVPADPKTAPVNFAPVGSGPYRFVGVATKNQVFLERWEGYKGAHPGKAPGFELVNLPKESRLIEAFEKERVHYSNVTNLQYYLARKGTQGAGVVQAVSLPQASVFAFFLNCDPKLSLLGDLALRQALAELTPWQELARGRRFFPSRLASGFWPPESMAYDPDPHPLPQVEKAAAILEAAGWKVGPEGIRQDARGRSLVLLAYDILPLTKRSSLHLLAIQAARAGIRIRIVGVPDNDIFDKAAAHDGDIWSYGWTLAMDPDVDSPLFTSEGYRTKANVSAYLNPEVDRLFDQGRHTLEPKARREIYHRISEILYRDKPVIPTTYSQTRVLIHRRLHGVTFGSLGQSAGFWPGRRGWTLEGP